jgi:polyhydroxyalkanoate synthesis regulator phasin
MSFFYYTALVSAGSMDEQNPWFELHDPHIGKRSHFLLASDSGIGLDDGIWEVELMFEMLDKLMLAGLGALTMTRERAETLFEEYVSKGQAARDARSGFIKEVMDNAEKTRAEFQRLVADQVRQTVNNLHLATKDDLLRIESKIDQLLAKSTVEQ